ncbi:DJ-1/PfpI family protein [Noviherbaspirillum sp. CPCC 100848]|uniref:DJ-1/PfpI family protein n=1 Tax=Noviherbaspirillum album TaxID=3080276 RepID=A0ABU6JG72_9BURK|nr:DJ-1/PfpI family protein [Noviherbaspirillum sp. CPCC 100848]MEC4722664.1 DJ-1/PfpI family protein [Noviherbaspirillum sp. CPCC 100848]
MRTVAILVFPNVQSLDVTGPMDVFAEANRFLEPADQYQIRVIGTEAGLISCANGLLIQPHDTCASFSESVDLLMVAGGPTVTQQPRNEILCDWLRAMDRRCAKIASVCNGAFLLAYAGLLEGLHATTHWNDVPKLAARFPNVRVEADRIFARSGRIYTSAGVTAGIDLALHLVYEDCGPEVSLNVAKRLVVFSQRNGGQSQFSPYLAPYTDEEASLVQTVQQYVLGHLHEELNVERLANVAGMSVRNFSRVFARDARMTPSEFVERARVDAGRALLETSAHPLKTIAHRCGFGTSSRMRAAFVKNLGVTAQQYRDNFGAYSGSHMPSSVCND